MGTCVEYTKSPLTIQKQAHLLKSRGLLLNKPTQLEHYLATIGYYRLSAYWLPFEQPSANGHRNHKFLPNTYFEQILELYVFDRKLRLLIMDAIERIEVSVRTQWANSMGIKFGSHAHMQAEHFKEPSQHSCDLAKIAAELQASRESFVVHYKKNYKNPSLPPIWAIVETMSLGTLSRWLKNTVDNSVKKNIASKLNLPTAEILEDVLHRLTIVRNTCAHHGRIWNRRFTMKLPIIKQLRNEMIPPGRPDDPEHVKHLSHCLYNYLVVMAHLMQAINPCGSWKRRLLDLLSTMPTNYLKQMGFPDDWRGRALWK